MSESAANPPLDKLRVKLTEVFEKGAGTREEIEERVSRPVENLYVRMAFQRELKRLRALEKK